MNEKMKENTNATPISVVKEIEKLNAEGRLALITQKVLRVRGEHNDDKIKELEQVVKGQKVRLKNLFIEALQEKGLLAREYAIAHGAVPITEEIFKTSMFEEYRSKLYELRKDGEYKVASISDTLKTLALKRNVDKDEKKARVKELKAELKEAKAIEKANHSEVKRLSKEAAELAKIYGKEIDLYEKYVVEFKSKAAELKKKVDTNNENARYSDVLKTTSSSNKEFVKLQHKSNLSDIEREANDTVIRAKDDAYNAYLTRYDYVREVRNNHSVPSEKIEAKWKKYKHSFTVGNFLVRNALYIVIILFFIACAIIAGAKGENLLTIGTLTTILTQSSTKLFFSLGVAGLILLAGTDLSIGRMTGMGASFSCLFLSQAVVSTNIGNLDMRMAVPLSILLGLVACILSCTLFSALAGFFSAKFNMHPFITTLSTQLLIFGIMMVCFSQVSAFSMDSTIKNAIVGTSGWKLILFAAIAVVILWFIWNKTKFGRHMYAVGDNKEAARVSGINVFWVTMGVFILAGVCYGFGGFLEGARIGSANPSLGLGTELDAIAACVIGGISFSGGRGKISGAVVGTIIFTSLTVCLSFLGLDINYQYIFKGIIILAAVCLDSLKLLKKQ